MSQVKLFSSTGTRVARRSGKPKKQKVKKPLKTLAIWLLVILCLEALYFFCVYTNNSFVKKWRTIYINTAMDTMRHQWLATYFIPKDVIDEVRYEYGLVRAATVGKESNANWGKKDDTPAGTDTPAADDNVTHINPNITHESEQTEDNTPTAEELEKQAQENFYSVFWELDRTSMEAYLAEHPDTLANGWDQIYINEAGFDDEGTSIQSIFGEQVLAIDAKDGVLLLRISGKGYRGVLAVGKDPSRLSIEMATTLGTAGQLSGTIAEAHNGVLAMNANGFLDPNGAGNGGLLAGYTMSNGRPTATISPPTPTSASSCTRTTCSISRTRCLPSAKTALTRRSSHLRSSSTARSSWTITGPASSRVPASARARTTKFSCWSSRAAIRLKASSARASTTAPRSCSSTSVCRPSTSTAVRAPCCGSTASMSRSRRPPLCATPAAVPCRTHGSIKKPNKRPAAPGAAGGCLLQSAKLSSAGMR